MKKPKPRTQTYLDYNECCDYIEQKYGYDTRDFAGKYKYIEEKYKELDRVYGKGWRDMPMNQLHQLNPNIEADLQKIDEAEPPYLDFWHWVVDRCNVSNGGIIYFSRTDSEWPEDEKWIETIYNHFLDEFADENGELAMRTEW